MLLFLRDMMRKLPTVFWPLDWSWCRSTQAGHSPCLTWVIAPIPAARAGFLKILFKAQLDWSLTTWVMTINRVGTARVCRVPRHLLLRGPHHLISSALLQGSTFAGITIPIHRGEQYALYHDESANPGKGVANTPRTSASISSWPTTSSFERRYKEAAAIIESSRKSSVPWSGTRLATWRLYAQAGDFDTAPGSRTDDARWQR